MKKHKHFLDRSYDELGRCETGDVIYGCIDPTLMKVINVNHHKGLNCDVYICEFIEGPCKGQRMDIYPFYAYKKVTV